MPEAHLQSLRGVANMRQVRVGMAAETKPRRWHVSRASKLWRRWASMQCHFDPVKPPLRRSDRASSTLETRQFEGLSGGSPGGW